MRSTRHPLALVILVTFSLALLAAGCGDDDSDGGGGAAREPAESRTPSETQGVLEDSFEDNSRQWLSPPEQVQTSPDGEVSQELGAQPGDARVSITNGALQFDVTTRGAPWFWPSALNERGPELTDQRVETTIQMEEPAAAGVACRIANTGAPGDASHYELGINSAGAYIIFRIGPTADDVELLAVAPADLPAQPKVGDEIDPAFEFDPANTYTIAGECRGGQDGTPTRLALVVNGDEVLTAEDPKPIEAGVGGIWVSQTGLLEFQPFQVRFVDWAISTP